MKPVFGPIQCIEMDLRNKTTSEFRTVSHGPLGVPNFEVPLYLIDLYGGLFTLPSDLHTLGLGKESLDRYINRWLFCSGSIKRLGGVRPWKMASKPNHFIF